MNYLWIYLTGLAVAGLSSSLLFNNKTFQEAKEEKIREEFGTLFEMININERTIENAAIVLTSLLSWVGFATVCYDYVKYVLLWKKKH